MNIYIFAEIINLAEVRFLLSANRKIFYGLQKT